MIRKFGAFLTVLALLEFSNQAKAQQSFDYSYNLNGQPFIKKAGEDIQGNPYLKDEWSMGKVVTGTGKVYDNLKMKYDLNEDYLLFNYESGKPVKFEDGISKFTLYRDYPMNFACGFTPILKQNMSSFYQVLSDGDTKLLKRYVKDIIEVKGYTAAALTREYRDNYTYYVYFKDGKIEKADNPKKSLYALAGDKKAKIDEFVKANAINFKKDQDLGKVFDFYNTLGN